MTQNNPLFSDHENPLTPVIDETKDYSSELIGDGKKYKDVSAAARGIVEKDVFIERLKAENAAMRNSLKGEQKIDEFLDNLKKINFKTADPSNAGTPPAQTDLNQQLPPTQTTQKSPLSLEDVEALFNQKKEAEVRQANLNRVLSEVQKAFGANFREVLAQKTRELGTTPEFLTNLAQSQPQAFLKLVEADKPQSDPRSGALVSSVNTQAMPNNSSVPSGAKTESYYKDLRKKIGDAKFFRPEVQNELTANAFKLGEAFFQ